MNIKKFIQDQDWLLLMPGAVTLTWLSWPVGHWHLWSFLWIGITVLVLVDELISDKLSPDKHTISNVMRQYRKDHPVKFWLIWTAFLLFAWSLIVHVAT